MSDDLISRQDAIEVVQNRHMMLSKEKVLLINDLEKLPSAEPHWIPVTEEPMSDLISRQAAIKKILGQPPEPHYPSWYAEQIKELPSAEPKTGRWLYCEDSMANSVDGYRCDQCGFFVPWDYQHKSIDYIKDYNFCPHCGAKMEVTE